MGYKKILNLATGEELDGVVKMPEEQFIAVDQENPDYQVYLAWLAQGNTPDPAVNNAT